MKKPMVELVAILLLCAFVPTVSLSSSGKPRLDVLITNGRILDGSGNPWFRADIGIRGGRVVAIGNFPSASAARTIDARGSVVSPGFIDMMGGASLPLILDRTSAASKLLQGVTTILVGEGDSPAPQTPVMMRRLQQRFHFAYSWIDYAQYFSILSRKKIALNVIHNVGAAQVRRVVLGNRDVTPTPAQLRRMEDLVAQAMRQGAVGLSTALIYPPGSYAKTPELVALAKVAARYGGVYFTHVRNESGRVLPAIQEAIEIGRQAHIPVHVYHLKAAGRENWSLVPKELSLIQQARDRGVDISADAYPYVYNGIGLDSFIAPWHFAAGRQAFIRTLSNPSVRRSLKREIESRADWENWYMHVGRNWGNVLVASVPTGVNPKYAGMSIAQIAESRSTDPWTVFFDLVEHNQQTTVNCKSMNEEQKQEIYRRDFVSVSSDAEPADPATSPHAHPRAFGTFPRILAKYVRSEHVLTLPDAIRAMTSLPADQLMLYDRGRIAPGMAADIVIFNPRTVRDTATYSHPASYPIGIQYVLVNGRIAVDNGKVTGVPAGKVIRHRQ